MRSQLRIVLWTLLLAGVWAAIGPLSRTVADMELFVVRDVEVRGLTHAEHDDVVALLDLEEDATVWGDVDGWATRVEAHPLVESARVRRRVPGTLVVEVVEWRPVALAPTPTLEPVDARGKRLPVDPATRRLDLPLIEAPRPVPGSPLLPRRGRILAAEVGRLMEADTDFLQMVSEVSWLDDRTVVARWSRPAVEFHFAPGTPPQRIREGLAVLADALGREPETPPTVIDLRFADQVVLRRAQ